MTRRGYQLMRDCAFCEERATAHVAGYGLCQKHGQLVRRIDAEKHLPPEHVRLDRPLRARKPKRLPNKPIKGGCRHTSRPHTIVSRLCTDCGQPFTYTQSNGGKRLMCFKCRPSRAKDGNSSAYMQENAENQGETLVRTA